MKSMDPASETEYEAMPGRPKPNQFLVNFYNCCDVNIVDACVAAGAMSSTGIILRSIDLIMGKGALPLFNGAMLTMAIVFFANPAPPPYKVFLQCTIGAWFLGFLLRFFMLMEAMIVTILVAGFLLIFFKWAKVMFPPTLGVAVFLISDQTLLPPVGEGPWKFMLYAFHWLATPWLAGSVVFYVSAKVTSKLRAYVKENLKRAKIWAKFAVKTDAELKEAFKEIDADGSGSLDPKELTEAWKKATTDELTLDEAIEMIKEVDDDNNGTLDADEFIQLIRKRCEQSTGSFADQFSDKQLKDIFKSYDYDGNNEMDKEELVVAWKRVANKTISCEKAQEFINQGATNGNSNLDVDEFVQVVRAHA